MPFVTTTQRYFVFNVAGGSEPDLKIRVERLLGENITEPDKVLAPRDVYVGINRCPESRCPGKGDNSVRKARLKCSGKADALSRETQIAATMRGMNRVCVVKHSFVPSPHLMAYTVRAL